MSANTTRMSTTQAQTEPGLDRVAVGLLLGFVASLQVSIALANVLLAATLVVWVARLVRDRTRPEAPPFMVPLLAYGAMTLVASAFSLDPVESFVDSKQLLLFLLVPAFYDIARGQRATTVIDVIITIGAASAAYGIIQYGMLHYDSLRLRPQGALTHYMTYSGILMLVVCAATARLVFGSRGRIWPALVMPALVVALALTLSRNAWVGGCVAVGLLFMLKDFRLAGLLPVVIALVFAFAPDGITDRMMSMVDLRDPTNQDRLAMAEIGARIVQADPLTGVGPNMVPRVYAQYRPAYAINASNPHLHNVPLQIAAERGLPALAVWVWFIASLAAGLFRSFRRGQQPVLTATALAAVAAMLAAGMFEYNFGDSEFLMLFLVLVTLPFAAMRGDVAAAPDHA
ncbi:MAG: O-antigen ligase family protein [Acidobacteria bacterium]|nr:O-antigen ligase family protein [Acidobacteriota bacterium]